MALSKIDIENMITGEVNVANGGTGLSSGTSGQFLKFTGSTTLASAADNAGITTASIWRVTSNFDGDADPIASNWEEMDAPTGYGELGSNITQSSGIFTFPETGIYSISYTIMLYNDTATGRSVHNIKTTHDNSTYAVSAGAACFCDSGFLNTSTCHTLFDVTNVTTHKVQFEINQVTNNSNGLLTGTDYNYTYVQFIRLGDT
jgi:hypothetical protein